MAGIAARGFAVLAVIAANPALAATPRLAGGGALDISLTRIVLALLLCMAAAVAAVLILKGKGGRLDLSGFRAIARVHADRRIAVLETRRISAHADACLLRCDGIDYLILSSANQQQVLRETPAATEQRT